MDSTCFTLCDTEDDNKPVERIANIHPRPATDGNEPIPLPINDDAESGIVWVLKYDYTLGEDPWRYSYPIVKAIPLSELEEQKSELILNILTTKD